MISVLVMILIVLGGKPVTNILLMILVTLVFFDVMTD